MGNQGFCMDRTAYSQLVDMLKEYRVRKAVSMAGLS